jgi:hypothetical protein
MDAQFTATRPPSAVAVARGLKFHTLLSWLRIMSSLPWLSLRCSGQYIYAI